MCSANYDYNISIIKDEDVILDFDTNYKMDPRGHKKEIKIVLDKLIEEKIEDGKYTVTIYSAKRILRIYNIILSSEYLKKIEFDLIYTKNKKGTCINSVNGEISITPPPIFIPDYTIYDIEYF